MASIIMLSKYKRFYVWIIAGAMLLLLFHLGPPQAWSGTERIIGRTVLPGGERIFLTSRFNKNLIDAYSVNLYCVFTNSEVDVTWLGYEDSYWWGASVEPSAHESESDQGVLKVLWTKQGSFNTRLRTMTWTGEADKPHKAFRIGREVHSEVPACVAREINALQVTKGD